MDLLPIALTVVLGVAMGAINNVAGGAGVLGLIAFEYLFGLPLETANPSTRIAAVAVGVFSCLGFVFAGRKIPPQALRQAMLALPGALLGAQLALGLPAIVFRGYLVVVMILLLRQQLRPLRPDSAPSPLWQRALGCFCIGLHMGYVQVGTGLVATLVLAKAYDRDLLSVNAATSATSLTIAGAITWTPAISLAVGCAAGSYLASKWSVKKGGDAVRKVVLVIATLTLLEQARQIALLLTADA